MRHYESRSTKASPSTRSLLTEENLRLHRVLHIKERNQSELETFQTQTRPRASDVCQADDDCAESDDGDVDAIRDIELRRAASLEALQAYGGCFVSGFLAMQEPLPWKTSTTIRSASSTLGASTASADSPRPDSDTLSHVDVGESPSSERRRSWRSIRGLRNAGRKSRR